MRFDAEFRNINTGASRVVSVDVTTQEVEKAGGNELYLQAYAMRHLSRNPEKLAANWQYVAGSVRRAVLH